MWNQEPNKTDLVRQAEHLKALRKEKGWSKSMVCSKIGSTFKTYDSWEKGEKIQPTTAYLINLSDLYNVSIEYVLGRSEDRNIGNSEISEATGLSETSIEVLRFLNSDIESQEDRKHHQQIISLINAVLEETASKINEYQKDEAEGIWSRTPVENIFTTMYQYTDPGDVELSFLDDNQRITVKGQAAVVDINGNPTIFTLNELTRLTLLDRIKDQLRKLMKGAKNNG